MLAGELSILLGHVEVFCRHAIDGQLRSWNSDQPVKNGQKYEENWLEAPAGPLYLILNGSTRAGTKRSTYEIAKRKAEIASKERGIDHPRAGVTPSHDDVLSWLTMGFWKTLLPDPAYRSTMPSPRDKYRLESARRFIWEHSLSKAFPHLKNEYVIRYYLNRARFLRNRIAHQESLLRIDVHSHFRTSVRLVRSIDPRLGDWVAGTSSVVPILKQKPS